MAMTIPFTEAKPVPRIEAEVLGPPSHRAAGKDGIASLENGFTGVTPFVGKVYPDEDPTST